MKKELKRLWDALSENHKNAYTGQQADKAKKLVTDGQHPDYFFIACSDSRYDPNTFPGLGSGDAFIAEHIAALVPPYDAPESTSVAAAVDYAVSALKVKHIIIMGHTHCGGVKGMLTGGTPGAVGKWLDLAKGDVTKHLPANTDEAAECDHAEKKSVAWSYANLAEYPAVKAAIKAGTLEIHGWRYNIKNGAVESWNPKTSKFEDFFKPAEQAQKKSLKIAPRKN